MNLKIELEKFESEELLFTKKLTLMPYYILVNESSQTIIINEQEDS